jgi:hypothetical protein
MLASVSIPFVRAGILTDVTAPLRAIVAAKSLGKFPHIRNLDFEREHPSPTSRGRAGAQASTFTSPRAVPGTTKSLSCT